jgi:hypothetical protein
VELVSSYVKGRPVPRRIVCPKCGALIDLSGESAASLTPEGYYFSAGRASRFTILKEQA